MPWAFITRMIRSNPAATPTAGIGGPPISSLKPSYRPPPQTAACDPILEDAFGSFEPTPEMEAEMRDAELAMAQCMRERGIDMPDPDPSDPGMIAIDGDVDPEVFEEALDACSREVFGGSGAIIQEAP